MVLVGGAILVGLVVFAAYGSMAKTTAKGLNASVAEVTSAIDNAASLTDSVTLCHIPPGNPGNARTTTAEQSEVSAHLAHGDYLGPCLDTEKEEKKEKD